MKIAPQSQNQFWRTPNMEEKIMADALAIAINVVSIILTIISLYLALR